jgi:hypothetical protein
LLVRGTSPVFPGHTERDLLASDDAVVDETVNGRRTRSRYFEQSTMRVALTVWPDCEVPPPRGDAHPLRARQRQCGGSEVRISLAASPRCGLLHAFSFILLIVDAGAPAD